MAQTKAQLRQAVRRNLREVERFRTALTGAFTVAKDSAAVTGAASLANDELQAGDELQLDDEIRQVIKADSATAVTVNTPYLAGHAGVTGYVISRRTWTDEEVDEAVNGALADLHTLLLADAPAALLTRVTGNLAASKTATVPTTLATVETVEVLGLAGTDVWTQLRGPLPLVSLQPSGPLPWWYTQVSFTAAPTAYGWTGPSAIELNSTPPGLSVPYSLASTPGKALAALVERGAGAAIARHGVAVDAGDDRGGFARQVDQDRGGRATVLRAVIDAGQHDQRSHGRQRVGGR